MYKLKSHIDVDQFCEENGVDRSAYMSNAHWLLEQGKIATMSVGEATPASGLIHITEAGRKALEVAASTQRPQCDAQEAWVEVARLN